VVGEEVDVRPVFPALGIVHEGDDRADKFPVFVLGIGRVLHVE